MQGSPGFTEHTQQSDAGSPALQDGAQASQDTDLPGAVRRGQAQGLTLPTHRSCVSFASPPASEATFPPAKGNATIANAATGPDQESCGPPG